MVKIKRVNDNAINDDALEKLPRAKVMRINQVTAGWTEDGRRWARLETNERSALYTAFGYAAEKALEAFKSSESDVWTVWFYRNGKFAGRKNFIVVSVRPFDVYVSDETLFISGGAVDAAETLAF